MNYQRGLDGQVISVRQGLATGQKFVRELREIASNIISRSSSPTLSSVPKDYILIKSYMYWQYT